jgi:hypothetical protein
MTFSILFGLTRLILGIVIANKIFRRDRNNEIESNSFFDDYPVLIKMLSIFLISSGIYTLVWGKSNDYSFVDTQKWENGDKQILVDKCMAEVGETKEELIVATKKYCNCSVDGLMENVNKKNYLEIMTKNSQEEQIKLLFPYFKNCLEDLNNTRKGKGR